MRKSYSTDPLCQSVFVPIEGIFSNYSLGSLLVWGLIREWLNKPTNRRRSHTWFATCLHVSETTAKKWIKEAEVSGLVGVEHMGRSRVRNAYWLTKRFNEYNTICVRHDGGLLVDRFVMAFAQAGYSAKSIAIWVKTKVHQVVRIIDRGIRRIQCLTPIVHKIRDMVRRKGSTGFKSWWIGGKAVSLSKEGVQERRRE